MFTTLPTFLGNYAGNVIIGIVLGGILWLFLRDSSSKSPAAKLGRARTLIFVCVALLAVYGVVQLILSKLFAQVNFWGLFVVIYAMIAAIIIPLISRSGFLLFLAPRIEVLRDAAKRRAPSPRTRFMIVLGGCLLAAIGYFLPWSQIYRLGTPPHLDVYGGVYLDAHPPYFISLFNLGNYPYSFLFTLVALPLTSLFVFLHGHNSLLVQVFGRSLHAIQILLLLISVFLVSSLSVGGRNASLLGGFWLVVAGLVIVFIEVNWPYADTSKPSKTAFFALSAVILIVTIVVLRFGGVNIAISLAKALGGVGVAIFIASFLYDLLGPGLFSAGFAVVRSGMAAFRSET